MTAKEKAIKLFDKYATYVVMWSGGIEVERQNCKQCALIAVDEIIKLNVFDCNDEWSDEDGDTREYWQEVKQEIEKL